MFLRINTRVVTVDEVIQIHSTFGDVDVVLLKEAFNTLMIPDAGML
jgi:hypothetical protein